MKHMGIKLFVIVIVIMGLCNALSSLLFRKTSSSNSSRSGFSYYSRTKNNEGLTPKSTSKPSKPTANPRSTKPSVEPIIKPEIQPSPAGTERRHYGKIHPL